MAFTRLLMGLFVGLMMSNPFTRSTSLFAPWSPQNSRYRVSTKPLVSSLISAFAWIAAPGWMSASTVRSRISWSLRTTGWV